MSSLPIPADVTDEQLASWGFAVEVTDHVVGMRILVSAGMTRRAAIFAAWCAGRVRMAVKPVPPNMTWAQANGCVPHSEVDPEMLAWAQSTMRVRP